MPFFDPQDIQEFSFLHGIKVKAVYGAQCSVSQLELPPLLRTPLHHHENEQISVVTKGSIEYTIGEDTRHCGPGTIIVIPANTPHALVVASEEPAQMFDVFSPPRDVNEIRQVFDQSS